MMDRPDPDALLKVAAEEDKKKGKLTIFFGSAPGVGKTYTMLQEAQSQKKDNIDIVVGFVQPHGRRETEDLLKNLPVIPLKKILYKNLALQEMDLDGVLAKAPKIAIVDELAHTNAPGSRNEKRYQDVAELLNAGIDVYTTLNVQHLESLKDIISQISNIEVKETIPDSVFTEADEIKIVDIPPKDLLKRLAEGKVYVADMAEQAVKRFFIEGNLLALRELALRCAVSRVTKSADEYRKAKAVKEAWPVSDKILVGIYSSPSAEQLVRAAYKLAYELSAHWTALHVATEKDETLSDEEQVWLTQALNLARELGAEVVSIKGESATDELIRYGLNHGITKILIGKPQRLRLNLLFVWKMLKKTKGIDLYLFSTRAPKQIIKVKRKVANLKSLLISFFAVAAVAGIGHFLKGYFNETNTLFLMLLPVAVIGLYCRWWVAVASALLSLVLFDFFFVKPYYTFAVSDIQHFLSYSIFLAVIFFFSNLASRLRFQVAQLRKSESANLALYQLTRDLLKVKDDEQMASKVIEHVRRFIPCEAAVFFFGSNQQPLFKKTSPGFPIDEKELAVASWVFQNGKPAGPGTKTLREAKAMYLPIRSETAIQAVLGLCFHDKKYTLTSEDKVFLETVGSLGTMVLEEKNVI